MNILLIIAGVVAVLVVFGFLAFHFDKKRTADLDAAATQLGLSFSRESTSDVSEFQNTFKLFSKGRSRAAKNVTYGVANGTGVWLFDYKFVTGGGKNSHTHRQTVACFRAQDLFLPAFSVEAEGMLAKLGSALFKTQDIDFDSHPEFSKRFLLRGDSEDQIRAIFDTDVLSFMEQQDKHIRIEASGPMLLFYRASRAVKPNQLADFLQEGFRVFKTFRKGQ